MYIKCKSFQYQIDIPLYKLIDLQTEAIYMFNAENPENDKEKRSGSFKGQMFHV